VLDHKTHKPLAVNYNVDLFPFYLLLDGIARYSLKYDRGFKGEIAEFQQGKNRCFCDAVSYERVAGKIIKEIEEDKDKFSEFKKSANRHLDHLLEYTASFADLDLKSEPDEKILEYYQTYCQLYREAFFHNWTFSGIDGVSGTFSNKLETYLKDKLKKAGKSDLLGKYFSLLMTPTRESIRQLEKKDLLNIASKVQADSALEKAFQESKLSLEKFKESTPEIYRLLVKHTRKYCWITFDFIGPALTSEDFFQELQKVLKGDLNITEELERIKQRGKSIAEKQEKYIKELNFSPQYVFLFQVGREFLFLKDYRTNYLFLSYYRVSFLLKEIARRLDLSLKQAYNILPSEMEVALLEKKFDPDLLNSRIKYCAAVFTGQELPEVLTGQEAKELIKKFDVKSDVDLKVKKLTGQCAYQGKARGKVKIVSLVADLKEFEPGDIMVSEKTDPDLVSAMAKAGAIITERGGLTSHAAIVSRELGVPCVIGVKNVIEILENGDLVEVNATKGIIKILDK